MEEKPPESNGSPEGADGPRLLRGLPASLLSYIEARGVLLTIEAQEALESVLQCVTWGVVAAVLAFSGWLPLMAALIWLIHQQTQLPLWEVAIIVGGAHLVVGALVFLGMMRRLRGARWFEQTTKQFAKDREWLGHLKDRR